MSQFSLADKVAIVTGASRGIGRAIALALADAGADVAICSRKLPPLEEVANEITTKGRQALAMSANIRSKDDLENLVGKTMDKYKRPKPPATRQIKLKSLQGMRIDRYHYFEVV